MPKYLVPAIDATSGIDSFDGSGYVSLPEWDEADLEQDLKALRSIRRDTCTPDGGEESSAYLVDCLRFDERVLGRFMEDRWAVLFNR